jgi:photosystem II stability/assembly factor-like uncharacterized protein
MRRLSLLVVLAAIAAAPVTGAHAATWVSNGPGPPQISSFGFDRTQSGVAYAGTVSGSVLRSTDGGATWSRTAPTGDDAIYGIASDGGRVIVTSRNGIQRSGDGGATWQAEGISEGIVGPLRVAIDPGTPDVVLLGTDSGLLRSTNGGASWNAVTLPLGSRVGDIVFDPAVPGTVYVANNTGAVISTNHGASFTAYNQGLGAIGDSELALDGTTLYAGGFSAAARTPTGGAAAWTDASNGLGPSSYFLSSLTATSSRILALEDLTLVSTGTGFVSWVPIPGPGFRVATLAADPSQRTRVLAGGAGLGRSLDGGDTWDRVDGGLVGLGVESVAALAARSALTVTETGTQRTDDLGATFTRSGSGLTGTVTGRPAADPSDPSRVFAFANNSLFGSTDGGRTWTPRPYGSSNSDGLVAVAPSDGRRVYAAGFTGAIGLVKRSVDGGQTWMDANSYGAPGSATFNFAEGMAIDPSDARVVYLSTGDGLRTTEDGGDHWSTTSGLPTTSLGPVTTDPSAVGVAYVIADTRLWRTADRGGSWKALTALPSGEPADMLVDPRSSSTLYAATRAGVFRSLDTGATWSSFSDGLPNRHVNALAIDRDHLALYAATDAGLAVASLVPTVEPVAAPAPSPPAAPARRTFKATTAFRLPSNRGCLKRPAKLKLAWLRPKGVTIDRVETWIGKRRLLKLTGAKARRSFTLRKLPSKRFTLSLRVTPRGGPTARATRTYKVCAKKRKAKKLRKAAAH